MSAKATLCASLVNTRQVYPQVYLEWVRVREAVGLSEFSVMGKAEAKFCFCTGNPTFHLTGLGQGHLCG